MKKHTKIVAGFFEDASVKRVVKDLGDAGFSRNDITLHTRGAAGSLADLTGRGINMEEAQRYLSQLGRGGTLVTVETSEADASRAVAIMTSDSLELEAGSDVDFGLGGSHRDAALEREASTSDFIPVIQERIEVAKRDVEGGGLRVHGRIVATPVEQEVKLHAEHVAVDRREVDRPVTAGDYRAAELKMVEHAEEARAKKVAHVVEDVRLGKTAGQHKETIHDTLKHTEVDITRLPPRAAAAVTAAAPELAKRGASSDGIAVIEESLEIETSEFESGGVVVRSRIVEEPIEREVSLNDERAYLDRTRTDRLASEADYLPADLEASEHMEKAYATKTAHVVEEVRLNKTATERTEKIRDSLRHTEIDVDDRRDLGWDEASKDFRTHFEGAYAAKEGANWSRYEPAYRLGHELACGPGEWNERVARARWEERNPGTWEQFKATAREAFNRTRGRPGAERHA